MPQSRIFVLLTVTLLFISASIPAQYAQYEVYMWENFDMPELPATLSLGYDANPQSVSTFSLSTPSLPAPMKSETARLETGFGAIGFFPSRKDELLSVFANTTLDRARLGNDGSALYQADFYLPPPGQPVPNFALLAAKQDEQGLLSWQIYRFGVFENGRHLFFSLVMDKVNSAQIWEMQSMDSFGLERPGWHRFQIIFSGQQEIYCAVDGRVTDFSPIVDTRIRMLNPGIMVSTTKDPVSVVADNLSIQWSPVAAQLPYSPWIGDVLTARQPNLLDVNSPLPWMKNPDYAWKQASRKGQPILVMFYTPRAQPYRDLLSVVPDNEETRGLLSKYVLLRVDANQLYGGRLAQKYGIVFLPTFVVVGADGQELGRTSYRKGMDTWDEVAAKLDALAE